MRSALTAAVVGVLTLAAGCGSAAGGGGTDDGTLILDFTPNAVHAGIYTALARDFDGGEGLRLRVRAPSSSTDSVRLLQTGRADLAILDIADLALARQEGRDVVAVMALVQKPLAAVIAQRDVRTPKALEGRRAGVAGLPSDTAVLRSVVKGAGGDPDRVEQVTIGFNAVPALLSRRVAAATAFWNTEGVALRKRGGPGRFREFRVDEYGAPAYPELVLCVTRETLDEERDLVDKTIVALRRGYDEALKDPELAAETLVRRNRGLDRELVLDELRALGSAFTAGAARFGELDRARLTAWAKWAEEFGLVREAPAVEKAFLLG
ncbi:MAG TPA: ABC transporter substrate-binding protein [Solirubrobacteraceae bacterium]|nr:ABC transporter substrate-binding protein [Solirubrobacteraceae bacterium]